MKKKSNLLLFWIAISLLHLSCNQDYISDTVNDDAEILKGKVDNQLTFEDVKEELINFINNGVKTKNNSLIDIKENNVRKYTVTNVSQKSKNTETEIIPVCNLNIRNGDKEGFALVVGDKRIKSVLAYSEHGSLNDTTYNIGLKNFIRAIPDILETDLSIYYASDNENDISLLTKATVTEHLCPVITKWGQGKPYNNNVIYQCSNNPGNLGGRAPIGCTNVAVAQFMAYYKKPTNINWNLLLTTSTITEFDTQERQKEIADLMSDIAQKSHTSFGCTGSGASLQYARDYVLNPFGYNISQRESYSFAKVTNLIMQNRLVLIEAWTDENVGHVWVIDGIKSSNPGYTGPGRLSTAYIHCNWGWYGNSDGWYRADTRYIEGGNYSFYLYGKATMFYPN